MLIGAILCMCLKIHLVAGCGIGFVSIFVFSGALHATEIYGAAWMFVYIECCFFANGAFEFFRFRVHLYLYYISINMTSKQ